jgi:hypothetical protein
MDQRDRGKRVRFGGVSRNGKRFVVDVSGRSRFDPWPVTSEKLEVFDLDQKKAIATLEVGTPAEGSWSALSPDGDLLLTASGDSLRVYRIP